jgi:hypothetical protein
MTARLVAPAGVAAPVPVLELIDGEVGSAQLATLVTRGGLPGSTAPTSLWASSASPNAVDRHPTLGLRGYKVISAVNGLGGRTAPDFVFPIGRRWDQVPAGARRYRRFELESVLVRAAVVANVPYAYGVKSEVGAYEMAQQTSATGLEIFSDSTINAGRWSVRSRLVDNGALTVLADTGIAATTAINARIFYEEGDAGPVFAVDVNGQRVVTLAGYAAMPSRVSSNEFYPIFSAGRNPGSAAGATDWMLQSRFRIWELNP